MFFTIPLARSASNNAVAKPCLCISLAFGSIIISMFESVTYFRGGPSFVTVCDRGEGGVKMVKNSVTYFMDGPYYN